MANDLTNQELIVKNFLKEALKAEFPNLDTSDSGAFMETFGFPHIKLMVPLLEVADRMKLTQSLDNAELLTEEEMDQLGASYFEYRLNGSYSNGYITLEFDDLPANAVSYTHLTLPTMAVV